MIETSRCWGCNAIIETGIICAECKLEADKDARIAQLEAENKLLRKERDKALQNNLIPAKRAADLFAENKRLRRKYEQQKSTRRLQH
jgi:hypothetical protein